MAALEEVPTGWLVLLDHDRAARGAVLDPRSGAIEDVAGGVVRRCWLDGWFVRRQGRLMALYRHEERLFFRCVAGCWELHDASVRRRVAGPVHVLSFKRAGRSLGSCRFLDWEVTRRWFIPAALDDTPFAESEDFDWSLFVCLVLNDAERRDLIGRGAPLPS